MVTAAGHNKEKYVVCFLLGVLFQYGITSWLSFCPPQLPCPLCLSCPTSSSSSVDLAKEMAQTCLEAYHQTVRFWDSRYDPGHWGISSPLYKRSKTDFVVEQVLKARENGLVIKSICELGIMAGASSLLFLLVSSPNAVWYGFDLAFDTPGRTRGAAEFLQRAFPDRAFYIEGDSEVLLPYEGILCDLVLIDGRKDEKRYDDIVNLRKMSHSNTLVILDEGGDLEYDKGNTDSLQRELRWGGAEVAYNRASKEKLIRWKDCSPSVLERDFLCVVNFIY